MPRDWVKKETLERKREFLLYKKSLSEYITQQFQRNSLPGRYRSSFRRLTLAVGFDNFLHHKSQWESPNHVARIYQKTMRIWNDWQEPVYKAIIDAYRDNAATSMHWSIDCLSSLSLLCRQT
jgi:hypothetical protein